MVGLEKYEHVRCGVKSMVYVEKISVSTSREIGDSSCWIHCIVKSEKSIVRVIMMRVNHKGEDECIITMTVDGGRVDEKERYG